MVRQNFLLWLQYGFSKVLVALWLNLPHAAGAQHLAAGPLEPNNWRTDAAKE